MASIEPARGGLRWVRNKGGGSDEPSTVELYVASNNTLAIFRGDLLRMQAAGDVYPAAAGETSMYVCVGCSNYALADGTTRCGSFLPAATTYTGDAALSNPLASKILAIPVANAVFEIDANASGTNAATAQSLVGNFVDIVATAGSTFNGLSGHVAGISTAGTSDGQLRIEGVSRYGKDNASMNDVTAANWKLEVTVNELQTAGV
jgi:hypothetical protein